MIYQKNTIDPIEKSNLSNFPILSNFYRSLLDTAASSERSFLILKRLKTNLRNTACENRLNGLAMMNIILHSNIMIDPDDILNKLAIKTRNYG